MDGRADADAEALVERGVAGNLATLDPPLSPMLWTSIATGKTADQHGVLGFVQPDETAERVVPVLGTTRKVKAVWNILNQSGLRSNVVGWWPSHPAEALNGGVVSNLLPPGHRARGRAVAAAAGHGAPARAGRTRSPRLRVHPQELTGRRTCCRSCRALPRSTPTADSSPRARSPRRSRRPRASTPRRRSSWRQTEWDFMAVYYDAIDHFGHGFMKYHPPATARSIPDDDLRALQRRHGGRLPLPRHDARAAARARRARHDRDAALGPRLPLGPPPPAWSIPREPAGPALEHRDFGVFVLAGPGIAAGEPVHGVSLLDVAPTVLTLFGLPVGQRHGRRAVVEAFEGRRPSTTIPSLGGRRRRRRHAPARGAPRPVGRAGGPAPARRAGLRRARPRGPTNVQTTVMRESQFYLARVHLSRGRPDAGPAAARGRSRRRPRGRALRAAPRRDAARARPPHRGAPTLDRERARGRSVVGHAEAADRAADRADAHAEQPATTRDARCHAALAGRVARPLRAAYRKRCRGLRAKADRRRLAFTTTAA